MLQRPPRGTEAPDDVLEGTFFQDDVPKGSYVATLDSI